MNLENMKKEDVIKVKVIEEKVTNDMVFVGLDDGGSYIFIRERKVGENRYIEGLSVSRRFMHFREDRLEVGIQNIRRATYVPSDPIYEEARELLEKRGILEVAH